MHVVERHYREFRKRFRSELEAAEARAPRKQGCSVPKTGASFVYHAGVRCAEPPSASVLNARRLSSPAFWSKIRARGSSLSVRVGSPQTAVIVAARSRPSDGLRPGVERGKLKRA